MQDTLFHQQFRSKQARYESRGWFSRSNDNAGRNKTSTYQYHLNYTVKTTTISISITPHFFNTISSMKMTIVRAAESAVWAVQRVRDNDHVISNNCDLIFICMRNVAINETIL